MKYMYLLLLVSIQLAFSPPSQAEATLDEVQLRMLKPYALPMRWDNVEGAPQWVAGETPDHQWGSKLHQVHLKPGQWTTVRVPQQALLRIRHEAATLAEHDLQLALSTGSGLYQQQPPSFSSDRHDMIVHLQRPTSFLVRITRPKQARQGIDLALFISRREPLQALAPYRELIPLPGEQVQMRRNDQTAAQDYWLFAPHQPVTITLHGPARYMLEHRYAYPSEESRLEQRYHITSTIDDQPQVSFTFETPVESTSPMFLAGHARVMGRMEAAYVEIPAGDHQLKLESSAPIVARLLGQQPSDYLAPRLNEAIESAQQVRQSPAANWIEAGQSLWQRGLFDAAIERWQKGINLLPDQQTLYTLARFDQLDDVINGFQEGKQHEQRLIAKKGNRYHVLRLQQQPPGSATEQGKVKSQLAAAFKTFSQPEAVAIHHSKQVFVNMDAATPLTDSGDSASTIKKRYNPLQARDSIWQAKADELQQIAGDSAVTPSERAVAAMRIAEDNARREGGLLAATMMTQSADLHPEYPDVQKEANELLGHHSFYRDLLPREKRTQQAQYFAHFIPRQLSALGKQDGEYSQGEQHLQALLARIPGAYFNALPEGSGSPLVVTSTGDDMKLILPSDVTFDNDQSILKPEAVSLLNRTVEQIRFHQPQRLVITGHTDSNASEAYNQRLSQQRARAVAAFLAHHGIDASMMKLVGKGELQPRADNSSAEGRRLNRRVELQLINVQNSATIAHTLPYHRYLLPNRVEPSILRVVVDRSTSADGTFYLQFDQQAAIPMQLLADPSLPAEEFAPAQGDAALEMLHRQFGSASAHTTSAAYAARHIPGRLLSAGVIEIPLPAAVREVHLWREQGSTPLAVALQYRASKTFAMSETAYLAMAADFSSNKKQLLHLFTQHLRSGKTAQPKLATDALLNHWLPLMRSLRSEAGNFSHGVSRPIPVARARLFSASQQQRLRKQALVYTKQSQWLLALEKWGALTRHGSPVTQQQAMLAQAELLLKLGEHGLADLQWRSLALYGQHASIRQQAIARLNQLYLSNNQPGRIVALWASILVGNVATVNYGSLLAAMVENGRYAEALQLGLMTGLTETAHEGTRTLLLRAAYQMQWWQLFQQLTLSLKTMQQRALWQGLAAMTKGEIELARKYFRAGGATTADWLSAVDRALLLSPKLAASPQTSDLHRWQQWHANHPGPYNWRDAGHLVTDFAGNSTLYSVDKDLFSRAYLATAEQSVNLHVMGPVRLRVDLRPVHPNTQSDQAVDGWLHIRDGQSLRLLPIINNRPVSGLQMAGDPQHLPGRQVSGEFYFGPGHHHLKLDAGWLPVMLQVKTYRPEIAIPLLPPLDPASLPQLAAKGMDHYAQQRFPTSFKSCFWRRCMTLVPPTNAVGDAHQHELYSNQRYRREAQAITHTGAPWTLSEQHLSVGAPVTPSPTPGLWPEAEALATGDLKAALLMHPGDNAVDAQRRMLLLLWWSEQNPAIYDQLLVKAEALGARFPTDAPLQSILARLTRNAGWQRVAGVQESAGLRYIPVIGWQPESTAMRVRSTLMPQLHHSDRMTTGNGRLLYRLSNLQPGSLTLRLSPADPTVLMRQPLRAFYQLDDATPVAIVIPINKKMRSLRLTIPAGDHQLRIGLQQALINQFLRVRMDSSGAPLSSMERPWHVATQAQPMRVAIAGPAWLRINQWYKGKVTTHYREIKQDFAVLNLAPPAGRDEVLYRVHQRALMSGDKPLAPRSVAKQPVPVAAPYQRVVAAKRLPLLLLEDQFQLGGQEDGSWSYAAQRMKRRDSEGAGKALLEQFFQLSASHRYFAPNSRTYYKTEMLARLRDAGGTTLGLLESIRYDPNWTNLNFKLDGGIYAQQGIPARVGSTHAWSALLNGTISQKRDFDPKTYHLPRLKLFARSMSLNPLNGVSGLVDQDVYTPYKATHRYGLNLGDTLYHQPWLDSLWYGAIHVSSNEDFNILRPDFLRSKLGWKQLLGEAQLDLRHQYTHYMAGKRRARSSGQQSWLLDGSWNYWDASQDRYELGFRLRYDANGGVSSGMLQLTLHDSEGRGYRDFAPSEVDFRPLRIRDIPHSPNNRIRSVE